ncbi:MAG: 2-dehydropantoate 2-reductase [Tardiphaga sp.]|nr:2-dehydropantoate 2-reductase [Tardiphaga sp.]
MRVGDRIVVAGAGAIGCFVGGLLVDAGRHVTLLARPRVIDAITRHGLRLTDFSGLDRVIAPQSLTLSDDPVIMREADIILVTVKSTDTPAMADLIARHAPTDAIVVSLQNGVGNPAALRARLPGRRVLAGMVPFNVQAQGDGRYHRASSGDIVIARDPADTAARLSAAGLTMQPSDDIAGVQWGKLIVNLTNALNALSGLPLREQLAQRAWRRLIADQMAEGVAVLKAAGIKPVSATPIPAGLMPHLLRLPDRLFQMILGRAMKIDPQARSSMSDDLARGRRTEIDFLQGVIVELARRHGRDAPVSRAVIIRVREAETAAAGLPRLRPEQIAI